jgi:uncharacterized protein
MLKKFFSVKVNEEMIACAIFSKSDTDIPPEFIFLHGAGRGVKERVQSIAASIVETGLNILTLDFSGHGESTGELKKSSLKKRVNEASTVINQFYTNGKPLIICGSSMGGYVAIKLLEIYPVDTLILFCPALYSKDAYNVQFDEGFTEIIRAPDSWKNTDVLNSLQKFSGNLLIVIGEKDEVIPPEVIQLIMENTPNVNSKELLVIPGCPHSINTWILDKEQELLTLHKKIKRLCFSQP